MAWLLGNRNGSHRETSTRDNHTRQSSVPSPDGATGRQNTRVDDPHTRHSGSGDKPIHTTDKATSGSERVNDRPPSQPTPVESETETPEDQWRLGFKRRLHQDVIANMDAVALSSLSDEQLRETIRQRVVEFCVDHQDLLQLDDQEQLIKEILDEAFGLGPLEPLMADSSVSDILINGPKSVYIEKNGKLEKTRIQFHDDSHVVQVVQRIAAQSGRRIDETSPTVDARLADGSRLNAVIPPVALDGPMVSIRRFGSQPLMPDDLLANHSLTPEMLEFLTACVRARLNILVSGGTGSGKTTLLNCLSGFISHRERIVTVEDAAELQLQQPHVVRLETRCANVEGEGEISTYDLVRNALRMRPDRIIVGECRGPEALDMLQAMNTGHQGSMTTVHANSPRDSIDRLEMMVGMAGFDIPIWIIRRQVAAAINVVLQTSRLAGGKRRIVKVSEITGIEGDVLTMHDIFEFHTTGISQTGDAQGYFCATGLRPNLLANLVESGINLPTEIFERRILLDARD